MATMTDLGVTAFIELLPGGTLTGIAKRALPGVELLAIKTPGQLDAARALIAAHRAAEGAGGADDNETSDGNGATGHNGLEPKEA
jgi:[acyl-carrier-protein] S-malonyltransferase